VTYVSWLDAARFCNWLENGQPTTGAENTNTTESGSYNLDGDVSNGLETAVPGAIWRLPTENEWYKAAYYDGATGGYSLYATQSNSTPGNLPGSGPNEANYYSGIFSATQTSGSSASQIYLTPVGTFSGSKSYYGTYDQGGDIYQWNDAIIGASRGVRGGAWDVAASDMESTSRSSRVPTGEHDALGFRVVEAIPEPASALLIPAGLAGLALLRRKPVIGEI
jgi:formylglycine-generating enzyme required for sulfatase activity